MRRNSVTEWFLLFLIGTCWTAAIIVFLLLVAGCKVETGINAKIDSKPVVEEVVDFEDEIRKEKKPCLIVGSREGRCYKFTNHVGDDMEMCDVRGGMGLPLPMDVCPPEKVITEKTSSKKFCLEHGYLITCFDK